MAANFPAHLRVGSHDHHSRCMLGMHLPVHPNPCHMGTFPLRALRQFWSIRVDNGRDQYCYRLDSLEPSVAGSVAVEDFQIKKIANQLYLHGRLLVSMSFVCCNIHCRFQPQQDFVRSKSESRMCYALQFSDLLTSWAIVLSSSV